MSVNVFWSPVSFRVGFNAGAVLSANLYALVSTQFPDYAVVLVPYPR